MTGPSIGTNLAGIYDWSTSVPFVDLFKTSRAWYTQSDGTWNTGQSDLLNLDAQGWVRSFTQDGSPAPFQRVSTILNTDTSGVSCLREGNYVIDWQGEGTLEVWGATVVSRSGNRIVIDPGEEAIQIQISSTDPQ